MSRNLTWNSLLVKMLKSLLIELSLNIENVDDGINSSKKIVSYLQNFDSNISTFGNTKISQFEYLYFWDSLFEIMINNNLMVFQDDDLNEVFYRTFNNSLRECPQLLLEHKIISYISSLELEIDFQDYLTPHFEKFDFSKQSEASFLKNIDVLTILYQKNKISSSIFGIIYSRLPNFISYSPTIFSSLKKLFYVVKEKENFLKEYLENENLNIKLFKFDESYYPGICHPKNGLFRHFLDGSRDKPTSLFDRKPLVPKNFNKVVKNEFYFFYNFDNKIRSMRSHWRTQMKFIADYFIFVDQQGTLKKSTESKKRKRSKFDPKRDLAFHTNSTFKIEDLGGIRKRTTPNYLLTTFI